MNASALEMYTLAGNPDFIFLICALFHFAQRQQQQRKKSTEMRNEIESSIRKYNTKKKKG